MLGLLKRILLSVLILTSKQKVRIDSQEKRRAKQGDHHKPEGVILKKSANDGQQPAQFEEYCPKAMGFIPDFVIAHRPRVTYADEPVAPGFADEHTGIEKECSQGRQHGCADADGVSQVICQGKKVQICQESHQEDNEHIESSSKGSDIFFQRVDLGQNQEKQEEPNGHDGHEEHAPETGHVAIHLVFYVPMGGHLLGKTWQQDHPDQCGDQD